MSKTLEQQRAEYAFDIVTRLKDKKYASELSSLVSKIPSYILTNGLGNTLAFLLSKGKNHHLVVVGVIYDWNKKRDKSFLNDNIEEIAKKQSEVMKSLVFEQDISGYTLVTDEILRLFVWLKRFCDAMIQKKGGE